VSGATWTIDSGVVSLAKLSDMATASVFYRKTAGSGTPEIQTLATLKTDLGLTGTNSGDQTSIVGISGTKAQFDTSVTDGNFLYVGDAPTSHAHGNITNAGSIGSTTDLPIVTTTSGVLTAGSFGTTAGTFAAGDDSRITGALSTSTAAVTYQPLDADLTSLAAASGSGIYERSGGNWTPVTIGTGLYLGSGTLSNTLDLSSYLTSSVASGTYVPLTRTLNTLALSADQTFAVGTTGTDFAIASSGTAHTFNIPDASVDARGLITTGPQTFIGQKTFSSSTITTSQPLGVTQTWNNAAIAFTAFNITVNNTAFSSSSKLFNFSCSNVIGGGTVPAVSFTPYTGTLRVDGPWSMGKLYLGSSGQSVNAVYASGLEIRNNSPDALLLQISTSYSDIGTQVGDASYPLGWAGVKLRKIADNQLELRSGTNAQLFRLSNTWTSTTSFEAIQFKANAGAAYQIGSAVGSAGGTNRAITIGHYDSAGTFAARLTIGTDGYTTGTRFQVDTGYGGYGYFNGKTLLALYGTSADPATLIAQSVYSTVTLSALGYGGSGYKTTTGDTYLSAVQTLGGTTFWIAQESAGANLAFVVGGTSTTYKVCNFTSSTMVLTPVAATSGSPTAFTLTGAAHTTLTLSTEATDVNFNLSRTVQFATGALTTQRAMRIQAPTYGFVGASTITTASTLSISGPPVAGTNATITNAYALNVESGRIGFTGGANTGGIYFAGAGAYYAPHIASNSDLFIQSPAKINWIFAGTQYMEFYNGIISTSNSIHLGGATYGTGDINIIRDSTGVLATRNGTSAQTFRVYNTYTSSTSYETLNIKGKSSANFEIGPENGSAGGTLRGLTIGCYPAGTSTIVGWAQFRPNASTGALEAFYLGPIADSTAVGGNARGTGAVDLQMYRTSAAQVASGTASFAAGNRNTASGTYSVAIGTLCTASGNEGSFAGGYSSTASGGQSNFAHGNSCTANGIYEGSVAHGYECTASGRGARATNYGSLADRSGQVASSYHKFAARGDAQYVRFHIMAKTTNATPTTMLIGFGYTNTQFTIPSGKIMFADILISGIKSDGSAAACYKRKVAIKNVAGTTALVGTVEAIGTDIEDNVLTDVAITADNTNDALDISVTGISGETWRWVAVVEGLEIAYGV
jgi:hypothetical protein